MNTAAEATPDIEIVASVRVEIHHVLKPVVLLGEYVLARGDRAFDEAETLAEVAKWSRTTLERINERFTHRNDHPEVAPEVREAMAFTTAISAVGILIQGGSMALDGCSPPGDLRYHTDAKGAMLDLEVLLGLVLKRWPDPDAHDAA